MNKVFETIYNHKSIRKFKEEPLTPEQTTSLLKVVSCIPTSINGQNLSVIIVEDKNKRSELNQLSGGQPSIESCSLFLLLVMDFYRSHLAHIKCGKEQNIHKSVESLLVGSVDIGILLGSLVISAESLGLGTVPIGAVRKNPNDVSKLFNLPLYTFPIVGLCIGVPDHSPSIKPRLPNEAVIFYDSYNQEIQADTIDKYDHTMKKFNENTRNIYKEWSHSISEYYQYIYYPHVKEGLIKQGFETDL